MSNPLYLSYSQITTFRDCPRKWKLSKIDKIVPNWTSSPLLLGAALDNAVEAIALNSGDPYEVFENSLSKFSINKVQKTLPEDIFLVRFTMSDAQIDILGEKDLEDISNYCKSLNIAPIEPKEIIEYKKHKRKVKESLTHTEQKVFNYIAYACLKVKGRLFIAAILKWYNENVESCVSTQRKVIVENDLGDKFVGVLDLVVKLKDGRTVLVDLKTSSDMNNHYPQGCVEESMQLAIYSQEIDVKQAAYLVIDKKIRKRGEPVVFKFIEGIIEEEHLDKAFDDISTSTLEIKSGVYPKNKDACFKFGKCEYYGYCHNKQSMIGLICTKVTDKDIL